MVRVFGLVVVGLVLLTGCTSGGSEDSAADGTGTTTATDGRASTTSGSTTSGTVDKALAGDWRVISAVLYYDNGKNTKDVKTTLPTRRLSVADDGKWQFGSSNGAWSVSTIEDSDWTGWDVRSYGPTRKLVLDGWSGSTSKGPIEESTGPVDFFWVIYRYTSDTSGPGTVWMKFGKDS